jgi:exosome complex component RRP42
VDRGIRESGMVDIEKLFIEDGKVWIVFLDIHVLDQCGNLLDACGIAATAALKNARMPKFEDGIVIRGEWAGNLPVECTPVPCTWAKVNGQILLDPLIEEEHAMESRLTITTTDTINAMQKGGNGQFSRDEILDLVGRSFEDAKKVRKMID